MPVLAYVQDIYDTFLATSREELENAAQKLKEMTPPPMNSMLEKQPRADAITKRLDRSKMEIKDVLPTTPGTTCYILPYCSVQVISN